MKHKEMRIGMKKVLLFNVGFFKEGQIFHLCKMLNIQPVKVKPEEYGDIIGYLAGIKGMKSNGKKCRATGINQEMMVFAGISSDELDVFLQKYNEMGIEKISLKAMVTPFNVSWTGEQLYKELVREHKSVY